jgi:biopolymer transport protein ExbD
MKFYARQRRMPQVIIVSLIDIFAILLIFVIVTTTFRREQPAVTIKLPESKTAVSSDQPSEPVVLTISPSDEIFLDAKKISLEDLKPALQELMVAKPHQTLALNADTKAPFGTVIKVIDVLRDAGVKGNLAAFIDLKKQ